MAAIHQCSFPVNCAAARRIMSGPHTHPTTVHCPHGQIASTRVVSARSYVYKLGQPLVGRPHPEGALACSAEVRCQSCRRSLRRVSPTSLSGLVPGWTGNRRRAWARFRFPSRSATDIDVASVAVGRRRALDCAVAYDGARPQLAYFLRVKQAMYQPKARSDTDYRRSRHLHVTMVVVAATPLCQYPAKVPAQRFTSRYAAVARRYNPLHCIF